jgi:hypothetical protein
MWKGSETTFETNSETRGKNMHMKLLNEKKRVQLTPRCIRGRIVTIALLLTLHSVEEQ